LGKDTLLGVQAGRQHTKLPRATPYKAGSVSSTMQKASTIEEAVQPLTRKSIMEI
jgi:hypothetical protein